MKTTLVKTKLSQQVGSGRVQDAIIMQGVSFVTLINQEICMRILKDLHFICCIGLSIVMVSSDIK